jgi:hypothetical protein
MAQDDAKPRKRPARKVNPRHRWRKSTNYYPAEEGGEGPAPVGPVSPVRFEPVVPEYDLRQNEEPDYETLPQHGETAPFPDIEPTADLPEETPEEPEHETRPKKGKPAPGTGRRLDLDA